MKKNVTVANFNNTLRISFKVTIVLFVLFVQSVFTNKANAAPANPKPFMFTQSNGNQLVITMQGDEYVNWAVTEDGYTLLKNGKGGFEYATMSYNGELYPSGIIANTPTKRNAQEINFLKNTSKGLKFPKSQIDDLRKKCGISWRENTAKMGGFPSTGTRKMLMILANFNNTTTSYTQANFNNYMNQVNYNNTGSFRDFYLENSYNQLTVNSTVTVWVTVPNTKTYYGPESKWAEFVRDAVNAADAAGINFADFDNDGNGTVDGVAVIHQGVGQEESGNTSDIWSHNWSLSSGGFNVTKDGKTVDAYTCQPEKSGSSMASIGVMCHEFGHNLGLPDFYDTDYSTGGSYNGTGNWDMMASGSYNGSPGGSKPAHHNAWSKIYLNWATPTTISAAASISMTNSAQNAVFYKYTTATTNEYYLLENRQLVGFDAALPGHGLIVYHVDGSYISSHMNANNINATSHQGLYPKAAGGSINAATCPFPGTGNKTSFTDATTPNSKSWAGASINKPLTLIAENTTTKTITFDFMGGNQLTPTVTTNNVSTITETTATCGGNVTNQGASAVTARGVCWATTQNPTTSNSKTSDGTGTGTYTSSMTGLTANTTYYVRAYATNSSGTGYGAQVSFTTNGPVVSKTLPYSEAFSATTFPTGWTEQVTSGVTNRWAVSATNQAGGAVNELKCSYQNVTGTTRMVTPYLNTLGMSKITLSFKHFYDDYAAGATLKIQSTTDGTNWTDAPWSLNSASNANIGPVDVTVDITNNLNSNKTQLAFVVTGNLNQIDYWYIDNVNIKETINPNPVVPTVTTTAASNITTSGATTGGNVTADGGATVTAKGVCWSTSTNPTISNSKTTDGTGTGVYTSTITGLAVNTKYYVRAYATNSVGTAYGTEVSFTTGNTGGLSLPYAQGFESTTIPSGWAQENVSGTTLAWKYQKGGQSSHPAAAHGGNYNAFLYKNSTTASVTKLVTPALNVSSVTSPTLTFWHTQEAWSGDQDILKVYYKTSATGTWTLLATYSTSIAAWKQETIALPNGSSTYYIAFEGTAKYGYGVCVDDVNVAGGSGAIAMSEGSITNSDNVKVYSYRNIVNITTDVENESIVSVYNMMGQAVIKEQKLSGGNNEITIDDNNGIYIVRLVTNGKMNQYKVVIKN